MSPWGLSKQFIGESNLYFLALCITAIFFCFHASVAYCRFYSLYLIFFPKKPICFLFLGSQVWMLLGQSLGAVSYETSHLWSKDHPLFFLVIFLVGIMRVYGKNETHKRITAARKKGDSNCIVASRLQCCSILLFYPLTDIAH